MRKNIKLLSLKLMTIGLCLVLLGVGFERIREAAHRLQMR